VVGHKIWDLLTRDAAHGIKISKEAKSIAEALFSHVCVCEAEESL
jgi:hypothetical protein